MNNNTQLQLPSPSAGKQRSRGFTLVELLIVIAIILVLAALGFGGAQAVLTKARNTKSLVAANNIELSVNAFYDEYGMFPVQNLSPAPLITNQGEGVNLITVLLGKETIASPLNAKQMPFLSLTQGKGKNGSSRKDGLEYDGSAVRGLYDFYGNPYTLLFDDDINDEIIDPFNQQIIRGRKVLIYTPGKDRSEGDSRTNKDNIISWK
jgi:prepilin-type N-terminal cleavage/methylation domain-containing protein